MSTPVAQQREGPSHHRTVTRTEEFVIPRRCTLEGFAEAVSFAGGVHLADLEPLTSLLVRTENSLYHIIVLQPPEPRVLVQGGQFFPDATRGSLNGSSFGGSFLKLAWIGFGLSMEICHDGRRIVTSPVRGIEIRKNSSLPGPF